MITGSTQADWFEGVQALRAVWNSRDPFICQLRSQGPYPDPNHYPAMMALQDDVAAFLKAHPDTIRPHSQHQKRPTYSIEFVELVLNLINGTLHSAGLTYTELAGAVGVKEQVLKPWLLSIRPPF